MKVPGCLSALVLLAAAPAALADTIRVPGPGLSTIQDAVDWALPGDVVLVQPGVYSQSISFVGKSGIELRGTGRPVLSSAADIHIESSGDIVVRGFDMALTTVFLIDVTDVSLVDLHFHDGGSPIVGYGSSGVLVSRCRFRDTASVGVSLEDAAGIVIEKCRFEDLEGFAVSLVDLDGGADGAVLSRNRVSRCGSGFYVEGEDVIAEDNRMTGLAGAGIDTLSLGDSSRGTFRRNRIQTSGNRAIQCGWPNTVVERNSLAGGGIEILATGCVVRGNLAAGTIGDAIGITMTAIVESNRVRRADGYGIFVGGDDSRVVGNSTSGTVGHGVMVFASNCRVSRNRVVGASDVGLLVDGTENLVTENRATGSGVFDLADTAAEGASIYEANRFGTVAFNYVP